MSREQHWRVGVSYWKGKKRDIHTLQRLSESKFRKVLQYSKEGDLIKVWPSRKEVGVKIFKDYLIRGKGAKSKIYEILYNTTLKGRLREGSYWLKEQEILNVFNEIPLKVNLENLEFLHSNPCPHPSKRSSLLMKSIKQYDLEGNYIKTFNCTLHVLDHYRGSLNRLQVACRMNRKYLGFFWEYGDKVRLKCDKEGKVLFDKKTI